jgi:hypothetical protein
MILTLGWKEYREHRSIWLTMVIMTLALGHGLALLISAGDTGNAYVEVSALTILGMAVTYGVVCGAMMFAGERENATLVFLDIFLGRRGLLWCMKFLIGVVLAVSEALAVAGVLYYLRQKPPQWLPTLIGQQRFDFGFRFPVPHDPAIWFRALPLVTLEAFAWGMLGSSFSRRVVTGAGLAALMVAPLWLITICAPSAVFFGVRVAGAGLALLISATVFQSRGQEAAQGPSPRPADRHPLKARFQEWDRDDRFDPELWAPGLARRERSAPALSIPEPPVLMQEVVLPARPRVSQAGSGAQVLFWLTFRQGLPLLCILGGVAVLVGLFLPAAAQVLWPACTLLLGVACGTAAFAHEQTDLSYQFLAAQHLPLKQFWNRKIVFWFLTAILVVQIALWMGALVMVIQWSAARLSPPSQDSPLVLGFDFGPLAQLLGPVLYAGIWLVYGFAVGQVLVLLCRKNILAVMLATLGSAAVLALWLPSLICGGMGGWQVWLPPLTLLVATRILMRPWAGGRIKERKPLLALIGFGLAALVWIAANLGFRAWEIPDVGEPMDRKAFRASVPAGRKNRAGRKIQQALGEFRQPTELGLWERLLEEAVPLPVGVLEHPREGGPEPVEHYLPTCLKVTRELRDLAEKKLGDRKPKLAFEHLGQILALSRTLRNKASVLSYVGGIQCENSALEGLDEWLAHGKPSPALLRRVLKELNRHAAETPAPLDCLQTECLRARGLLEFPTTWSFARGKGPGRVQENWLVGGISLSLTMPWEEERKIRLWRLVWAGLFRGIASPYHELPDTVEQVEAAKETTRAILRGWLPAEEGPDASLTAADVARLLDSSWLSDERLFSPVVELRAAATQSRWQVDAARLQVALALYQLREKKPASRLKDLVPNYLPQLPVDPYSGQPFRYRISKGEEIDVADGAVCQRRHGPDKVKVLPGQGIFWSTGPDRVDHGGRKHGGGLADDDPRWSAENLDLVTLVPQWPK